MDTNRLLAPRIISALRREGFRNVDINEPVAGEIHLVGNVADRNEQWIVFSMARSTAGARVVVNELGLSAS